MCGIVGYIGENNPTDILLTGLEKLEYRGYDSAGIALLDGHHLHVYKEKGRIEALRQVIPVHAKGTIGIGHTRWATHGVPSKTNAHPHQSQSGRFVLVHNGVIENEVHIKREWLTDYTFTSETDTEVVVQLIDRLALSGLSTEQAFTQALAEIKGSYAFALIDREDPTRLYVAKNKSPLLIGVGENFHAVTSDAMAMIHMTNQYVEIEDGEVVILEKNAFRIYNQQGDSYTRTPFTASIQADDIEKGTYPHYMLKEIDEQPAVLRNIIQAYQDPLGQVTIDPSIVHAIQQADRLYIIACGTSYHAGLVGKDLLEKIASIPVEVHVASEFVYNTPLLSTQPFFIFISQSGETADSRACLVKMKQWGHPALTITNVAGSTLSRESDYTLLLHAGPEIAVASTKAYTAQIAVLALLAVACTQNENSHTTIDIFRELSIVAQAMERVVDQKEELDTLCREFYGTTRSTFFIGRGMDYHVALEAALKLKEISYIQAEGFAGGELKHGSIALIEDNTPVLAIITQPGIDLHVRGNVKEVVARGANPFVMSMEGLHEADDTFVIPAVHPLLTALVSIVPLQLMSYYTALHRECDVDKPRNLAKSVTVE